MFCFSFNFRSTQTVFVNDLVDVGSPDVANNVEAVKEVGDAVVEDSGKLVTDTQDAISEITNHAEAHDSADSTVGAATDAVTGAGAEEILATITKDAEKLVTDTKDAIGAVGDNNNEVKDLLTTVAQDAEKLVENAKNTIAIISQNHVEKVTDPAHSGDEFIHSTIDKLNAAAQKMVDKSYDLNQKMHQLIGNTVGKVPGAQKVVDTSSNIYKNVHKLVGSGVGKLTGGAHKTVDKLAGILNWGKKSS